MKIAWEERKEEGGRDGGKKKQREGEKERERERDNKTLIYPSREIVLHRCIDQGFLPSP